MKFIFALIAIETASVTGSIAPNQSTIKRQTKLEGQLESLSNKEALITVCDESMNFLHKGRDIFLSVRGMFGNIKDVADSIEKDFSIIVAAMESFDPKKGDDSVRDKVSAVRNSVAPGGVEYYAEPKKGSSTELEVPTKRINFRLNCVSHGHTINWYDFQKFESMPSVTVDDTWVTKKRDVSSYGPPVYVNDRILRFKADSEEYKAGFREAEKAATKHCQSVYKLVMSAPSLRKAVLELDN